MLFGNIEEQVDQGFAAPHGFIYLHRCNCLPRLGQSACGTDAGKLFGFSPSESRDQELALEDKLLG